MGLTINSPDLHDARSASQVAASLGLKDPSLFKVKAFIAGAWQDADNAATFVVRNPANGQALASVPAMCAAETRRAIEAANAAWPNWQSLPAKTRASLLRRWYEL